ncbi:MAG: glycoside hydrolase family 2 protein [Phycisphaerales bacterium]
MIRRQQDVSTQHVCLNGRWQLTYGPQPTSDGAATAPLTPDQLRHCDWPTISAAVPGNVELDLIAAGKLPANPEQGNRIYLLREYETCRWWYRRTFTGVTLRPGHRIELVFDGIDCIAAVFVNGRQVGNAANMLIEHRFDITDAMLGGDNELAVRIDSAVLAARECESQPAEFAFACNWESLAIRKAPHMYGWDILPRIVSAGLWRGVRLEVAPPTRWRSVYLGTIRVDAATGQAEWLADWDFATDAPSLDGWKVRLSLNRNGATAHRGEHAVFSTHGRAKGVLKNADLWWPRGCGEAALYDAVVELLDAEGRTRALHESRVGLRTVKLDRTDITTPETGGQFVFVVNGEKVFIKGSNWVPLDALHSRDPQHLRKTFDMVTDLNCNMLRCWGGNVYEDHMFFDLCDEQGVMVWQDFALACGIYPKTEAFNAVMRHEAESVIRKLRNHASLVLWAGNNEIDDAYQWAGAPLDPNTDALSRVVLAEQVRRFDPLRDYLPSSPYHSPELIRRGHGRDLMPEDHLWGPRDDFKGPYYTQSPAHFVSETGYHGCPDRASLEQMMDADHLWPWQENDQWLTHAVRPLPGMTDYNGRIKLMVDQIGVLFDRIPDDLDEFILASQISQAEAVKFFIERMRAGKWRRTGILWWNLRDGWPVISDAVVDYYHRKKLAYHYIQRVQTDVCAICTEPEQGRHAVVVVNDSLLPVHGSLRIWDADTNTALLDGAYQVPANGIATAGSIACSDRPAMWLMQWTLNDATFRNHYLAGPRPFNLTTYRQWLRFIRPHMTDENLVR